MGTDCKSVGYAFEGSNPSLATIANKPGKPSVSRAFFRFRRQLGRCLPKADFAPISLFCSRIGSRARWLGRFLARRPRHDGNSRCNRQPGQAPQRR